MSSITDAIRSRKSIYPKQYIDKPIPKEIIQELLENANHAPTHKLTEPWRFKVFTGASQEQLGEFLANKYKETAANFAEARFEKIKNNYAKAGAVIAIIMHRNPKESIPEWEEIAAVSCAVQNLWLTCGEHNLGGYWGTPGFAKYLNEHVPMEENETCLGFFYLGYHEANDRIMPKKPIEEKVAWFD